MDWKSKLIFTGKNSHKSFDPYWEKFGINLLILALVFLLAFIFRDFIFQKKLYLFKDNGVDSLVVYLPRWTHIAKYFREYGIPMWSFNCGMGQNIFPGQISNPFNLILILTGELIPRSIIYVELLKFIGTGIVSYYYFRTMKLKVFSAVIGSLMLAFCGYMVVGSSGWYRHSSLVFFGIFLLLAFEQLFKRKNIFLFPLAVIFLSGSSLFHLYLFSFFLFFYTLLRFFQEKGYKWLDLGKLLLKMGGLGALGLGMNAVFLISPFIGMLNSPRISGESGYFSKLFSKPMFAFADPLVYITGILRFFSSDILGTGEKYFAQVAGENTLIVGYQGWHNHFDAPLFYCSIPALLLFPQLFVFLNKQRKKLYLLFLSLWCIILVFPFFRYAIYLFIGDYYKEGFNFFISIILVFIAMQALYYIDEKKCLNIPLLAGTAIMLLVFLYLPSFTSYHHIIEQGIRLTVTLLIVLYTGVIYFISSEKYSNTGKIAFFLLLVGELACFSNITINHRDSLSNKEYISKSGYNDYTVEAVADIKANDTGFFRIQKDYFADPTVYINLNDSQMQDFYGITSYNSFNQKYYIAFIAGLGLLDPQNEFQTRWASGLTKSPLIQSFTSVKYGLAKNPETYFKKYGYIFQKKVGDVMIYRNPFVLPLGFTCRNYILSENFANLKPRQKVFCMMKAFVIPEEDKGLYDNTFFEITDKNIPKRYRMSEYSADVGNLKRNHLKLKEFSPNDITGTIDLDTPAMMILTIPYDPGWQAEVDGKITPVKLINFGLMGLPLKSGKHIVRLRFQPPFLFLGVFISILAVGGYIALIFFKVFPLLRKKQITE